MERRHCNGKEGLTVFEQYYYTQFKMATKSIYILPCCGFNTPTDKVVQQPTA